MATIVLWAQHIPTTFRAHPVPSWTTLELSPQVNVNSVHLHWHVHLERVVPLTRPWLVQPGTTVRTPLVVQLSILVQLALTLQPLI